MSVFTIRIHLQTLFGNMKFFWQCIALIFCFTYKIDCTQFRCDYSYTNIGWFKYHEIPATWDYARFRCSLEGGTLASPTTPEIKALMLESFCVPEILTGIAAKFSKGDYYSIEGVPLAQIPHEWTLFEPDNKNNEENCIALHSDGKFSDVKCDEPRPYMCFREHSNVDVTVCGTPDPDYHFETETNNCYKFHTEPKKFEGAHLTCAAEGAHLAVLNSEKEAKLMSEIMNRYPKSVFRNVSPGFAIIGYTYVNSQWTTIQGQSLRKAGYAKFSSGQPDNYTGHETCGSVFVDGSLNDCDCNYAYPFICEKIPNYPPVCDNLSSKTHTRHCDSKNENFANKDTSNVYVFPRSIQNSQ